MVFTLEVLRARKGDCLLLHYGTKAKPGLIVIDGGPDGVFKPHLRPRLEQLKAARGLPAHKPLPIDLLMVSHVDDDHIQGILELTAELRQAAGAPLVQIRRLWHNSFDEILGKDPEKLFGPAQFGAASYGAALERVTKAAKTEEEEEIARHALDVLASIPQGHQLRLDSAALNIPANTEFGKKLIVAAKTAIKMPNGPSFVAAGPMKPEVIALRKDHDKWLKALKKKGLKPGDVLAAYADRSVSNLSSLVLLATSGKRSMLLTGDARGDKVLKGLELVGLIKPKGTLHVDIMKVPHHGSARNVEQAFFSRITADHYVFSGDGEHGNPDRETMEMLAAARPAAKYTIHLTYPIGEIDEIRKDEWAKDRAKAKKKGKKVKPAWSHAKHSLEAFFDAHPPSKLEIVDDQTPHLLDLGDDPGPG